MTEQRNTETPEYRNTGIPKHRNTDKQKKEQKKSNNA